MINCETNVTIFWVRLNFPFFVYFFERSDKDYSYIACYNIIWSLGNKPILT